LVPRPPGSQGQSLQGQGASRRRHAVRLLQAFGEGRSAGEPAPRRQGQARLQDRREEDQGGWRRCRSHRLILTVFLGFSFSPFFDTSRF